MGSPKHNSHLQVPIARTNRPTHHPIPNDHCNSIMKMSKGSQSGSGIWSVNSYFFGDACPQREEPHKVKQRATNSLLKSTSSTSSPPMQNIVCSNSRKEGKGESAHRQEAKGRDGAKDSLNPFYQALHACSTKSFPNVSEVQSYFDRAVLRDTIGCRGRVLSDLSFATTTVNSADDDERAQMQRLGSWGTIGTMSTMDTYHSDGTSSNAVQHRKQQAYDDDGHPIDPKLLERARGRRSTAAARRKRVVHFEYPPISSLRQFPRLPAEEVPNLFFTEEELDQLEEDRVSTYAADDVEVVAISKSNSDPAAARASHHHPDPSGALATSSPPSIPPSSRRNGATTPTAVPSAAPTPMSAESAPPAHPPPPPASPGPLMVSSSAPQVLGTSYMGGVTGGDISPTSTSSTGVPGGNASGSNCASNSSSFRGYVATPSNSNCRKSTHNFGFNEEGGSKHPPPAWRSSTPSSREGPEIAVTTAESGNKESGPPPTGSSRRRHHHSRGSHATNPSDPSQRHHHHPKPERLIKSVHIFLRERSTG